MDPDSLWTRILPSDEFSLGVFTHFNKVVESGTSISGVTLTITATVAIDDLNDQQGPISQGERNFVFDFVHDETLNWPDGDCANGANEMGVNRYGCADLISVRHSNMTEYFTVNGTEFTLSVSGFQSLNGPNRGRIVSTFETKEKAKSRAIVVSQVQTRAVSVPEPASLGLLAIGLGAIGATLRRRRTVAGRQ